MLWTPGFASNGDTICSRRLNPPQVINTRDSVWLSTSDAIATGDGLSGFLSLVLSRQNYWLYRNIHWVGSWLWITIMWPLNLLGRVRIKVLLWRKNKVIICYEALYVGNSFMQLISCFGFVVGNSALWFMLQQLWSINSFWPSDAIWRRISGTISA